MDFATGAPGWLVLDTVCSAILLVEVSREKTEQHFHLSSILFGHTMVPNIE